MITVDLNDEPSETPRAQRRREAVWAVCDKLSSQGIKPTQRNVKMHHSTGSDTDIQKDVNAWFDHVFALHTRRKTIPDLPDSLVAAFEKLWQLAVAEASETHSEEAARWKAARELMQSDQEAMNEKLSALEEELAACQVSLGTAQSNAHSLGEQLAQTKAELARRDAELAEMRAASSARETELRGEIQRTATGYERQLSEQRAAFDAQVSAMREDMKARAEELRQAVGRADEHYRDLERASIIEIDNQRQRARTAEEALASANKELSTVHIDVATARAELRIYRETIQARIGEYEEEIEALKARVDELMGTRHEGDGMQR